ncbi:Cobalamin biosynthesis protein CobN [Roseovarius mucosus DSM 17069]|uniref:magnesium chelatase n=1 Tax=Roseovarius mucosus DSM 17069 TaxID=1288298 RepID=A0A0A0HGM7_9RHOB|nr:Cobalamin biosynthesis protein CobN [Roseovarius mucosus DSM 17069]
MRDDVIPPATTAPYRVVILTLDAHAAGACARVAERMAAEFPGLTLKVHAAAEWGENPTALDAARADIARGDLILISLLFLEDHIRAILPDLRARRDHCDAMIGIIADAQIVKLTRMGTLDMAAPETGARKLIKRLRGTDKPSAESGEKKMKMLRRLPRILKYIPGKAQDLRAWFLVMQYWLGTSDDNIEAMLRFLMSRYGHEARFRALRAPAPQDYPEVGLYHPDLPERITTDLARLPAPQETTGTVGLLVMRSYVLSGDHAHYDAVIRAFEARGLKVIPAFASGLDGRPAVERFFEGRVDTLVSLTGFSLVGGPAYNDSAAAVDVLSRLDVPYVAAHPLEFQTLAQWAGSAGGLGPIETTMLVALPEIDGATNPTVFAGRHGDTACDGCARRCAGDGAKAMAPCPERIEMLAARVARLAHLRRQEVATRRVGIVLFGFPPNAGAAGTAAYLDVFQSLHNMLHAMAARGYDLTPPATVEDLRKAVLEGSARQYGQEANIAAHVSADDIVAGTPWLREIEAQWGAAPGKVQSDGRGVFILGAEFGNVFVGLQPAFGYEGDPMRLLFERGFAPTHAFAQFYLWLKTRFQADVLLHFGMHGALEFMPGKQAGPGPACWPDRLIGDMPNVYLYPSNNPSEASLAKRRTGAVTVTHLTPPLAASGLYKGLAELKDSLKRWREMAGDAPEREELRALIAEQAVTVDMGGARPRHTLAQTAGNRGCADPRRPACAGSSHERRGARRISRDHGRQRCRNTGAGGCHVTARDGDCRAAAGAWRALYPARARRRPDPFGRYPAHGAQYPCFRSVPHAHRIRLPRWRASGGTPAGNPQKPAAFGGPRALGVRQYQIRRRAHGASSGTDGGQTAVRLLWPPLRRGPHPARGAGPPAHRRDDDALRHFPRPASLAGTDVGRGGAGGGRGR